MTDTVAGLLWPTVTLLFGWIFVNAWSETGPRGLWMLAATLVTSIAFAMKLVFR